jgi:hypothetical protein
MAGEPGAAGAGDTGATVNVPATAAGTGAPAGGTAGAQDFSTMVPAEFKDRPYLKDVKDVPSLFKLLDNSQTLIGKRPAGIPQENAPADEWEKFHAMLRPEKPEGYEFKKDENLAKTLGWDDKVADSVKALFHKAGLSKRQALEIQQGYEQLLGAKHKEAIEKKAAQDTEFSGLAEKVFGKEVEKVLLSSKALIAQHAPDAVKAHLDKLDNNSLVILAGVLNSIKTKYIKEDQVPGGGNAPAGLSETDRRAKGQALMASEAYRNKFHPDHDRVNAEVQALYGTAAA